MLIWVGWIPKLIFSGHVCDNYGQGTETPANEETSSPDHYSSLAPKKGAGGRALNVQRKDKQTYRMYERRLTHYEPSTASSSGPT